MIVTHSNWNLCSSASLIIYPVVTCTISAHTILQHFGLDLALSLHACYNSDYHWNQFNLNCLSSKRTFSIYWKNDGWKLEQINAEYLFDAHLIGLNFKGEIYRSCISSLFVSFEMDRTVLLFLAFIHNAISSNDYCIHRFEKRRELLHLVDQQLDLLWKQLKLDIEQSRGSILKARTKVNKTMWAEIAAVIAGNIFRLAGRNADDVSYNEADAFDNAGRALYSISFMTSRAFQIVIPVEPFCGVGNLRPVFKRRNILAQLDKFQANIFSASKLTHPLSDIGLHPELLKNELHQFILEMKTALSCLLQEQGGQKLVTTIDMLQSALTRKWSLLDSILRDKISDIGKPLANHACLCT